MATLKIPVQRRKYHPVYGLDGGLRFDVGSSMIKEIETPACSEVVLRDGKVSKMSGTEYFAGTDVTPLNGCVMHMDQFYQTNANQKLMLHTVSNTYAYNATTEQFECITLGEVVENCEDVWAVNAPTTCAVDTGERKGTNAIAITIPAEEGTGVCAYEDFTSDDFSAQTHLHFFIKSSIAVDSDDLQLILGDTTGGGTPVGGSDSGRFVIPALEAGVWTEVSIEITTPGDLTTVESVALYVKVDKGAMVVYIDDVMVTTELTGDEDDFITSEVMNDNYIFASQVQTLRYWDMATATTTVLPGCTNYAAFKMIKFGERLCLYHTVESGTRYPQRVRWTAAGTPASSPNATDWSATGSGNADLYAAMGVDWIQNAEKLGNYVIIYGERTIVLQEYKTDVNEPFSFTTRVSGVGLAAARAIVNLGEEHIFLGWDDVYSYKGGREADRIGGRVQTELINDINPEFVHRSFMMYDEDNDEIRLYYPKGGSETPDEYYVYNMKKGTWSKGARSYTAFGYYETKTTVTWATATGTWDEQTGRWDDSTLLALAPLNMFGDSSGYVYKDSAVKNLAGNLIDGYWETKDFVTGDGYRRTLTNWMELNFEATGDGVSVSYSADLGVTWSAVTVFTLTDAWVKYNFDFEINSPQVRFRFRNATVSETFELRWVELGYLEASDRGA